MEVRDETDNFRVSFEEHPVDAMLTMESLQRKIMSCNRRASPRHYTVDPMLSASGNLFKCHEEILYLQPLIPPKRFDIFSPITGGCSEGLGVL